MTNTAILIAIQQCDYIRKHVTICKPIQSVNAYEKIIPVLIAAAQETITLRARVAELEKEPDLKTGELVSFKEPCPDCGGV